MSLACLTVDTCPEKWKRYHELQINTIFWSGATPDPPPHWPSLNGWQALSWRQSHSPAPFFPWSGGTILSKAELLIDNPNNHDPVNTKYLHNIGTMLADVVQMLYKWTIGLCLLGDAEIALLLVHRLRRWPNNKTKSRQEFVQGPTSCDLY